MWEIVAVAGTLAYVVAGFAVMYKLGPVLSPDDEEAGE